MSYNSELQNNNTDLQNILNAINDLPDAGSSTGDIHIGSDPVPEGTKVQIDPNAEEEFTIPDVLQSTGDSTVDTMSQAAITKVLRNIEESGGTAGEDGATFTPSVSADGVISWTNDKGLSNPTPVNIKGKTPVKGTDYFTAADKTEMVNSVIEALPKYTGGIS